ncbi:hypothetical protein Pmani_037465, partial [Petrolisthes manimaculis]
MSEDAMKVLNPTELVQGTREGKDNTTTTPPLSAHDIATSLQKAMLRMTGKFISEENGKVDYEGLKKSPEYQDYRVLSSRLREVDVRELDEKERMAFFINIYNALTVDSIAQLTTTPSSTLEVDRFWTSNAYMIGPHPYTLDQIEHGILRGNRAHPSTDHPVLSTGDPRLVHALTTPDPRIHFALNCGAK